MLTIEGVFDVVAAFWHDNFLNLSLRFSKSRTACIEIVCCPVLLHLSCVQQFNGCKVLNVAKTVVQGVQ